MIMPIASYLSFHWEPLVGLCVGVVLFGVAVYASYYWRAKTSAIRWTATHIFGDGPSAETSANSIFFSSNRPPCRNRMDLDRFGTDVSLEWLINQSGKLVSSLKSLVSSLRGLIKSLSK